MDVLLVRPSFNIELERKLEPLEPIGLQYLAALVRKEGYEVEILDASIPSYDSEKPIKQILAKDFKVLGISIPYQNLIKSTISLIDDLRHHGIKAHITIGGHPPTFNYEFILNNCQSVDSIVRGEGEYTFLEIVKKVCDGSDWTNTKGIAYKDGNRIITTSPRPLIKNLDDLPWPVRDVKNEHKIIPSISISSSRGCWNTCSFCSIAEFYRLFPGSNYRARSAGDVVDEIEYCLKNHENNIIYFTDDEFIGPGKYGRDRAFEIAEEIMKRKLRIYYYIHCRADNVDKELFSVLKKSGLFRVFLGVESGNQSTLDLFDKKTTVKQNINAIKTLKELEIKAEVGFIMIHPYSTLKEIHQDIAFLKKTNCGPEITQMNKLLLFSGMPLLKKLDKDNLLISSQYDYQFKFIDKNVEKFTDIFYKNFLPKLENLYGKICELKFLISFLQRQQKNIANLENILEKIEKLNNSYKKLLDDFFEQLINYAENDVNSSNLDQIEKLIDLRLAELSQKALEIKNLMNLKHHEMQLQNY